MRRFATVLVASALVPVLTSSCADPATTGPEPSVAASQGAVPGSETAQGHAWVVYNVQLRPENEVRIPGATPQDPTVESVARGEAQLKLRGTTLEYRAQIHNPAHEVFTMGHIHIGDAGTNGPIRVFLLNPTQISDEHIVIRNTITIPQDVADGLRANPSHWYVNFHTTQDPVGAIRDQLP